MKRDEAAHARAQWSYRGQTRPPFALVPAPGQESVWDYPRPPVLVADSRRVEVRCGALPVADCVRAQRVLETASPPTFYVPREDVRMELLVPSRTRSYCEWKGEASYFDLLAGEHRVADAAWTYAEPLRAFVLIAGWLSFYPERLSCFVSGEPVRAQGGGFYGGWVTAEIVGPYKGEPGTGGW